MNKVVAMKETRCYICMDTGESYDAGDVGSGRCYCCCLFGKALQKWDEHKREYLRLKAKFEQ
jgi:hypothetical protein